MLVSAFTFYRGAASLMAHDLASTPRTGLNAQLCGDAHCSNFGGFASPSRDLVFDLNDFDETLPGPFEWDVKRLAASIEIAGRDRGFDDKTRRASVLASVRAYREGMRSFAAMGNLGVWYSRLDVTQLLAGLAAQKQKQQIKTVKQAAAKAQTKDSMKAFAKLTQEVDGEPRIISDPPLIVPIHELAGDRDREAITAELMETLPRLPAVAAAGPPNAAGGLPLRGSRAQGGGRRQRGHALLDHADARVATTAIRSSSRSRRPARRRSSRCSAAASTATTASASSRASG